MALLGNLTVGIMGNMAGLSETFGRAQTEVQKFGKKMERVGRDISSVGRDLSLLVTGPIVAVGGISAKAASDFESAFAGVRKTVDATEPEFAALEKGIRDMAKEIPVAATEIAGVAEAAGQLGIRTDAILGFTETMVNLGVATNMTSEQAAASLARLANITQMPQEQFDRLGSTVVALGNNLATTESEIVEMGLRLAGAGNQIGLTEAQILSFAGALSSVGIEAEAGGTAFSRVMLNMNTAVAQGGEALEGFAQVAGMSTQEFAKAFEEDAAGAMITFIEGLGQMSESGADVATVLDELGLGEIRVRDALMRASGAGDLFRESLELGSQAWEENTALTNEAAERYKTFESRLQLFKNQLMDVAITLGGPILDALSSAMEAAQPFIDMLAKVAEWFADLNPTIQMVAIALAGFAAAIGPILIVLGMIVQSVGALAPVFASLAGPVGIAIGAIAGLIAIGVALWQNWDTIKEKMQPIFEAFAPMIETLKGSFQTLMESLAPVGESLKQLFESLMPILQALGMIIGGVVVTALGVLLSLFSGLVAAIGPIVNAFINLLDVVVNVVNAILALLQGDWQLALDFWNQATESAIEFFKNLWDGVVNFFSTFIQSIIDFFTNLYNTLVGNSIIPDMVNAIIEWFANMGKWAREKVSEMIAAVIQFFVDMKDRAVQRAQELVQGARDKFEEMKKAASDKVKEMFTAVRNKFNEMREAVQERMQKIRDKIEELWGKAQDFLANIDLKQIGKDIIQGLINGIGSMGSALWNKATELANNAKDAIKRALGVASPAKELIRIGIFTGEGFVLGIDRMISNIKKKAQEMAEAAIPDIGTMLGYSLPDFGGREMGLRRLPELSQEPTQPLVQHLNFERMLEGANFYVREEQDIEKIARELHRMMKSAARGQGIR